MNIELDPADLPVLPGHPAMGDLRSIAQELAALKRYDTELAKGRSPSKRLTLNVPRALLERLDAALALLEQTHG